MRALNNATRWAKAHPAETAAVAVGAATLTWLLWPRKQGFSLIAPPPTKRALPAEKGPPLLPGSSARAKEANAVIHAIWALPDATTRLRREGPYTFEETYSDITVAGYVTDSNKYGPPGGERPFATMAAAKRYAIGLVLTRRAAFALDNTGGCRHGTCEAYFDCRGHESSGIGFVRVTDGLASIALRATLTRRRVYQGRKGAQQSSTHALFTHNFAVPLPVGFGPSKELAAGVCKNPSICARGQARCTWLAQDFQVWAQLGLEPFEAVNPKPSYSTGSPRF